MVTINNVPEIFITMNKSREKVYNENKIYLKDKSNFEIEMFNTKSEPVGFEITINGKLLSKSLIILKPAERIFLDRYIDTNNKFSFETYTVDDNEKTKTIINNNGKIQIRCFLEKSNLPKFDSNIVWSTYPYYDYSGTITTDGVNTNNVYNSSTYTIPNNWCCCTYTSNNNLVNTPTNSTIETGRIGKGDKSDQTFETINFQTNDFSFHTIEYQLLPISCIEKQQFRIKCECGAKKKSDKWKFCPKCGNKF